MDLSPRSDPADAHGHRAGQAATVEGRFELLIRSTVDYGIYMLDPHGHVMSWNPGAEQIKGYSPQDIIGAHFSRFYTEEDRAAGMPETALRTAATAGRFTAEGWRVRKNGSRFWAMVVIDPIRTEDGLIGFAKITRDMTEQRNAQVAAMESERRFRLLVEGVTDYAIYMLDPDGKVTNWNSGAARIKGYTAAEAVGMHFSHFYTEEDAEAGVPLRALATARREGRYEAEGWRRRKDGSHFWAGVVIDAIFDNGVLIGFAKITRDLTERREAQIQLEQSREALFQSQKMEAIGQLTGGLAHDFNNLLMGISGSLELLTRRVSQRRFEDLDRYLAAAKDAANRAAALTHRLLAFARRQTLDPQPADVNTLITGMAELIRRSVGPATRVEPVLATGLGPILCDPNQLENAILNLCINARDAMPDGGQLTIETADAWFDERAARDADMAPGRYVVIRVTDTGTGMPPEVAAHAFEPFFTTKPTGKGTGLGLSMVYGFARQSGGQARIHSVPGGGTSVCLYLPRHYGEAEEDDAQARAAVVPRAEAGETVLIVDDEPAVRLLAAELLEELGYAAIRAEDADTALEIIRSAARIDLMVIDVGLPGGMNGRQMAAAARQIRPGLKALFITGYAEPVMADDDSLEPELHVLTKPFALEALGHRVRAVIQAG